MSNWFVTRPLPDDVTLVTEPAHVNNFLVEGSERAMLVDSGLGIADIGATVRELTDKRITVVNTHFHFDHSWGNGHFDDVRIHRSGVESLNEDLEGLTDIYLNFARRMMEGYRQMEPIDRQFFHLTSWLPMPHDFPEEFDAKTWGPNRAESVTPLDEGDVIDLGDRQFRVIHTPGHSHDEICLHEEHTGIMFAGDMINTGPLYTQLPESDLIDFHNSAHKLVPLQESVSTIYCGHFIRYAAPPEMIGDTARAFTDLLEDRSELLDVKDLLGTPAKQAMHHGFSIMTTQDDLDEAGKRF